MGGLGACSSSDGNLPKHAPRSHDDGGTEVGPPVSGDGGAGGSANPSTGGAAASSSAGANDASADANGDVAPEAGPDASGALDGSCTPEVATAKKVIATATTPSSIALYLMLDRSGSMLDPPASGTSTKWDQAVTGMNAFVSDPQSAGLDVALAFFPIDFGTCDGSTYSTPNVPLGRLPSTTQVDAVTTAITNNAPKLGGPGGGPGSSGTPIEGALRGAENFCMVQQAEHPDEQCVVVLITDGAPNGCAQDSATLAGIAAEANARAGIATFTVGMDGADFTLLDLIALSGASTCGATPACTVNGSGTKLIDALNKIRTVVNQPTTGGHGTTLGCQYSIPALKNGQALDPAKLNLRITTNGAVREVGQVPDMASCQAVGDEGWYYDDPGRPKSVHLCPATCRAAERTDGGVDSGTPSTVEVLFGCKTVTAT